MNKYYVKCKNFKQAALLSKAFEKHYTKDRIGIDNGSINITAGENLFIFYYKGTHKEYVSADEFAKKYFTRKKPSL